MIREQQIENRSDLTQVNVMINNDILKDWDKWCEKRDIKRNTLIIQAVDKFLHDKNDNAEILRKFEDILQLLSKKLEIIRISSIQQDEEESLSVLDKMLNELPRVKGAAIALDDNNERMYQMRIRPRITWHGGSSPTAIKEDKEEF